MTPGTPATEAASSRTGYSLDDRYELAEGTVYLTGIQALVRMVRDRALLDRRRGHASASFISGYEGSPLAGYDLELARRKRMLDEVAVVHRPGVNEELAATSVLGSQLTCRVGQSIHDGVTGYWYGKSPGLDRASDAIRHANLVGTDPRGGAVAIVGDDPAGKSSSVPSASEAALADLCLPTLVPADAQEVLDFGLHAPFLSRLTGLWSALKIVTAVADGASTVTVHPDRVDPTYGDLVPRHRPDAYLAPPHLLTLERGLASQRLPLAVEYARLNRLDRVVTSSPTDRIGIVAAGKTYLDLRRALRLLGLDDHALTRFGIRLLKIGLIWPLDPRVVTEFADGLDEVIVVEEKRPFLEREIKSVLYGVTNAPAVIGKTDVDGRELIDPIGELDADQVAGALARRLGDAHGIAPARAWKDARRPERVSLPLLTRTPYFCSGCPHNSSTRVPDGVPVGGGIGCHGMVLFMDDKRTGAVIGLTQMGGEGAQWLGMAPFLADNHFIQNLGDGTFTHSGSLAIRAAVAAGENITFKLLYNSTVAMTGGQDPAGGLPIERLTRLLLAEGVAKVVVTTEDERRLRRHRLPAGVEVHERGDIVGLQRELARVPGVTVLVHDQECAAEKRRKRKRGLIETPRIRVMINERICEGCGDCGEKSNCMSVHPVDTEFGRKTRIHQSSCNVDYACLDGDCPAFVTVTPGTARSARPRALDLDTATLPDAPPATVDDFAMRITGIGGTGVVTIAQIIGTAATIDGRFVRTLDQTGLAQKGGAVVSDLLITRTPSEAPAKVSAGSCDLYLVCDSLVGTDPVNLKAAAPDRTVAVLSTTVVPTGRMVADTTIRFPDEETVRGALDGAVARTVALDAGHLADQLFGSEQYANMIMVGAAFQLGQLPVTEAALERAITLNGASVATNIQAFRRGRQAIADPDTLWRDIGGPPGDAPTDGGELARLVTSRTADLVAYQNPTYAREYAEFVAKVRTAEDMAMPGATALTEAVAGNLHKLMAYKDEYEVARLLLDESFDRAVRREYGTDATYRVRLHPPVLRALGLKRKLSLGRGWRPVFRLLYAMRRLRGTRLDPFGHTPVRRTERQLVAEYRREIEDLLPHRTPRAAPTATRLASLPDMIRGYEQIKLDNVRRYRAELARLREELAEPPLRTR
ncbi:MAG TPA: indolepyruvate ferredoxin oxidoreductase family protein [Actinophytocola sp.]|uniref:indolepyruvate ferredoxin oxidoreductase family protein n=1 Tax=Actinophytocola sp. TaxID=1872138 RepID=UPI002DDCB766|nr:indolepyruvate ferredoxin oxidoreductase family protein [Actinophytocola sp.]HEV2782729.1 indolepyruvate ferredoxin oxidoreductase family protein [Actinophytocola sp.]